jgi:hypothetical protein
MRVQQPWWSVLVAAVLGGLVGVTAVAAGEQFLPVLGIREGGQRFILGSPGIPVKTEHPLEVSLIFPMV